MNSSRLNSGVIVGLLAGLCALVGGAHVASAAGGEGGPGGNPDCWLVEGGGYDCGLVGGHGGGTGGGTSGFTPQDVPGMWLYLGPGMYNASVWGFVPAQTPGNYHLEVLQGHVHSQCEYNGYVGICSG